jgi:hypothetical protein
MGMRVGLLTSWNARCGIAEYSRYLAEALRSRGVDVHVFGSRNEGARGVREFEEWATPVFDVQHWSSAQLYDFDIETVLAADLDVLHFQYTDTFFERSKFVELIERFDGVLALTYHEMDPSPHTFPHELFDLLYAHREDVGVGERHMFPQGMALKPPLVKTFGLGKSRFDILESICERNGWRFESSFGTDRWLEADELQAWLRDCDAIALWYEERRGTGGSAAVPVALSTRRPVFINDVAQFDDLPQHTKTLTKVSSPEELEAKLRELFDDPYLAERSWDVIADQTVADYAAAIERRKATLAESNGSPPRRKPPMRTKLFVAGDPKPLIRFKGKVTRRQRTG